jgi:D-sedoheptulose 7-phosphate isomerase
MKSKKIKFQSFFKDHIETLNNSLLELNSKLIEKASEKIIDTIINKKQIFVCGNGGSAAIANHYVPDYLKLIRQNTRFKPIVKSLSSDLELITAISNDFNYSKIFSYQAESLCKKGDLIIIVSSSGNSPNVVDLAKWAKKNKIYSISFTGFSGGKLKKITNLNIHVNINNYGLVEDSHHILMHAIMHYIVRKNASKKKLRL